MSLEDQLNTENAEAWRPEPGDMLVGEITGFGSNTTSYGTYKIVVIQPDDGPPLAVHAYHQVLENALREIKPQAGHRIGIKYLGKPEGKDYKVYKVVTDHPPVVAWEDVPENEIIPESDVPSDFPPVSRMAGSPAGPGPGDDNLPF